MISSSGIILPSFILSGIYFVLVIYGCRCLLRLHKVSPDLNTKKLFVMNCVLASLLRFLSFASIAMFNVFGINFTMQLGGGSLSDDDGSKTQQFFNKASLVEFDLPDFCFVSAYALLLVVWAEALVQSRRHWLSNREFSQSWLLSYVLFNVFLYSSQVGLYSLLFFPNVNLNILFSLIYLTQTGMCVGIPLLWLLFYLYLIIRFSGFPVQSLEASLRLTRLARLGLMWTCARLGWGVLALTSVIEGWLLYNDNKISDTFVTIILVSVFVICEVLPVSFSLRDSMLNNLVVQRYKDDDDDINSSSSSYGNNNNNNNFNNLNNNSNVNYTANNLNYEKNYSNFNKINISHLNEPLIEDDESYNSYISDDFHKSDENKNKLKENNNSNHSLNSLEEENGKINIWGWIWG